MRSCAHNQHQRQLSTATRPRVSLSRARLVCAARTAAPPDTAPHAARLSIPHDVLSGVRVASSAWVEHALRRPLKEPGTHATLHLVGVANYAPDQAAVVEQALSALQPDLVAMELPLRVGSKASGAAMLPYPAFLQVLMEHLPSSAQSPPTDAQGQPSGTAINGSTDTPSTQHADIHHEELCEELIALGSEASTSQGVGHDIFDPFEATGYFSGAELAVRPQQVAQALQLFGWAPGLEYAAAASWACQRELQLLCLDASLSQQQAWVSNLVSRFQLREADLPRQLQAEWRAAQEVVPPEHRKWDSQLGSSVSQLTAEALRERSESGAHASSSSSSSSDGGSGESSGGGGFGPDEAMAAYKVCKATAAGMLGPEATYRAVQRQAALQPLKFSHFERRALHMAMQLLEASRRNAALAAQARKAASLRNKGNDSSSSSSSSDSSSDSSSVGNRNESGDGAGSREPSTSQGPTDTDPSSYRPYTIAAVIGRQYVPMIQRLWEDLGSELWRGDVPRTFAPSVIEPAFGGEVDPDVESGGSRPVGHVAKVFGADGRQQ